MKKRLKYLLVAGVGILLFACSSLEPATWRSATVEIETNLDEPSFLDSMLFPYRAVVNEDMTNVIGRSQETLEKARPCSPLNNWAADAVMTNQMAAFGLERNFMVLLNVGGLRSTIEKGEITTGEVFELMPFDNQIVWVQMPMSSAVDVQNYLIASGGEPISNAKLVNGKLKLNIINPDDNTFWIMTSDYLMEGGDNMKFFSKKLKVVVTGKLLRDAFIEEIQKEYTISVDKTCRINVD